MQFKRMFSTDAYKGTSGYLRTQKNYEILRTVLYFAISLSLFLAGWEKQLKEVSSIQRLGPMFCLNRTYSVA